MSNSSRKKRENKNIYKKDKVNSNNDNYNEDLLSPRKNENDSLKIKDNSSCIYEDYNEDKKNNLYVFFKIKLLSNQIV